MLKLDRMGIVRSCLVLSVLSCGLAWTATATAQDYKVKVTQQPAPAAEPAPADEGDAGAESGKDSPGIVGGYSWGGSAKASKAPVRRAPRIKKKYDRDTPIVTYPGFRVLSDGTTLVWVTVSRTVPVQVEHAKGRVTYRLDGAHVQIWNNTYPLVTTYFRTPVVRTRLKPGEAGVRLVVDLREDVEPTHEVVQGPRGTMVLRIEVPPTVATRSAPPADPPPSGNMAATAPDPKPKLEGSSQPSAGGSASANVEASASFGLSGKKSKKGKNRRRKKRK